MLETPLGKIKILKNNKEIDYVAEIYNADVPPAKNKPLAGCYRINVDFEENDTISCELISSLEIEKGNSGGENYSCKVFQKDKTELTIGTFDEINECSCVCVYLENGLIFENLIKGKTTQLVFGVSWVTDLQEYDDRTWFASDPTYY